MIPARQKALYAFTFGFLILLSLYLWRVPVSVAPTLQTDRVNQAMRSITVTMQTPVETQDFTIDCPGVDSCGLTAFSALQKAVERDTIAMQYKTYEGLGVMITSLAGFENGQDGKYWVFEVNNQKIPVSADLHALQFVDHLLWKFVTPE